MRTYSIPKDLDDLVDLPNNDSTTGCPGEAHIFTGFIFYDGMPCQCGQTKYNRVQSWIDQIIALGRKLGVLGYKVTIHPNGEIEVEK